MPESDPQPAMSAARRRRRIMNLLGDDQPGMLLHSYMMWNDFSLGDAFWTVVAKSNSTCSNTSAMRFGSSGMPPMRSAGEALKLGVNMPQAMSGERVLPLRAFTVSEVLNGTSASQVTPIHLVSWLPCISSQP